MIRAFLDHETPLESFEPDAHALERPLGTFSPCDEVTYVRCVEDDKEVGEGGRRWRRRRTRRRKKKRWRSRNEEEEEEVEEAFQVRFDVPSIHR